MELKTFSEDDFDPKKWINKAWSASGNQEKEVFVANTVSRLQLYMKQLTNSLDETSTQIVTSIPRILQDASALQQEGAVLQQRLDLLGRMVQDVEEETGSSIESLQRIDQLKSRLESAAASLREADKWAALAGALEEALEAGLPAQPAALQPVAAQAAAAVASLEMLSEAPDYEAKRLQLETLFNRIEAAITPPFIEALTQMDAERSSAYVSVLAGMRRRAGAGRAWRRAAAARLAADWRRRDAPRAADLAAKLAHDAAAQVDWLTNVLKTDTPLGELLRLYTDVLLSVEPSPTKVVSASLKLCSSPEEGINHLLDLRADIDEFIACIRNVIDAPRQNKEVLPPGTLREFGRAAYAPLREHLPKYTEFQQALLMSRLDDPQLKQDDLLDQSRALLSVAERCEGWMRAAYAKAEKMAAGAASTHYVPAVDNFVTALTNMVTSHSRSVEAEFLASADKRCSGVLSAAFPASVALEAAANALLQALSGAVPTEEKDKIPQLLVWSNNDALSTDLPDFALSPQEYITEIGQYLMTLPQHLEMHLSEKQAPWQFLSELCNHTCEVYAEKILNIRNMDALGTKRCLTDIVYLSSVVEDLGSSITPALKNLEKSLRAAAPNQSE